MYNIIQLRVNVFIAEQQTYYEDLDDHDQNSIYLSYVKDEKIFASTRLLQPGVYPGASVFKRFLRFIRL